MTVRVVRVAVWTLFLLVLGISLLVVALSPLRSPWADTPRRLADLLEAGTAIPFAWFGAIIVSRRPGNRVGALLLLTGLATAVVGVGRIGTRYALMDPYASNAWFFPWIDTWSFVLLAGALFSLLMLFPTGKPVSRRWRPVLWGLVAWTAVSGLVVVLTPGIWAQGPEFENPIGVPALAVAGLFMLPWVWFMLFPVLISASGLSLVIRFRRSRGVERQQLKWLIVAVAIYVLSWIAAWILAGDWPWINVATAAAGWGVPVAIGLAVLRYRLYDIDRLINRTLVYGLLTVLLGAIYAGVVLVLGQVFGGIGDNPPSWAVAGATLAVAVLFQPARHRIQQTVDRRFNRRKYDAARTIEDYSVRLRDEVDLNTLSAELLAVVDQTMQPTAASLWFRPSAQAPPGGARRGRSPNRHV